MADKSTGTALTWDSTAVPGVTTLTPATETNEPIDVTDLGDTAREFLGGLYDGGQCTFTINYEPDNAVHAALRTDCAAGSAKTATVTFADGGTTVLTFSSLVSSFEPSAGVGGALQANVTLKVTGAITTS